MRDLMVLAVLVACLPLAFTNVFAAYLLWGWTSIIALDAYVFGFMDDVRINFIFALIALVVIVSVKDKERGEFRWNPALSLSMLLLLQGTLSASFAYDGNAGNWDLYSKFAKAIIFALIMPLMVTSRYRFHAMVVMLCLGMAFHGLIDGLKFIASGGAHIVRGLAKFGDNNHFAVVMTMVIPLLLYLYRYSAIRIVQWASLGCALVIFGTVVGTHSRGGFIALLAVAVWLVLTSRRRIMGAILIGLGMTVAIALAPASWTGRMETIKHIQEDSSFMQRVEAWQVSSAIALRNPFAGGGFHAVQVQPVWDRFRGETGLLGFVGVPQLPSEKFRAAHSIYFEVMGDLGLVGFLLFMALLANTLLTGIRIHRMATRAGPEFLWADDLARALIAVVVAFMVGGAGVSLAYSETIYVIVMLLELLKQKVSTLVAQAGPQERPRGVRRA
ncbi:MAG: putative O-glycosylation ligase, exosortase A system-associated [Rhodocyclaceae bacterium]|nr:putative O-glycosylation ligase, exosortase A system-associated [Rhodocyclaceae bacterium]